MARPGTERSDAPGLRLFDRSARAVVNGYVNVIAWPHSIMERGRMLEEGDFGGRIAFWRRQESVSGRTSASQDAESLPNLRIPASKVVAAVGSDDREKMAEGCEGVRIRGFDRRH